MQTRRSINQLGPLPADRWPLRVLWSPPALLMWIALGVATFAVVDVSRLQGHVMRGVSVAGVDIGGRSATELDAVFDDIEDNLRRAQVGIALPERGFSITGAEAGVTLDRAALRTAAMRARRSDSAFGRLGGYASSWWSSTALGIPMKVDVARLHETLNAKEPNRSNPVDPTLRIRDGRFTVLPGSPGEGIDVVTLAQGIEDSAEKSGLPITISANQIPLPSTYTNEELTALVDEATRQTSAPMLLKAGPTERTISVDRLRRWVQPRVVQRRLQLSIDTQVALADLQGVFGDAAEPARNARLAVLDDGRVEVVPAVQGRRCCAVDTIELIERALPEIPRRPVEITFEVEEPKRSTDQVSALGIQEIIGSFTTKHAAGEPRVKNIHRIADLIRGEVIPPGGSFSVNDFVGERTEAKGFVSAPTIIEGVIDESIGGGISQFATTFFNAAFVAGLDIPAYQPHSIYIKRYPYGKEATLSYPLPDLRVKNNTPYGVLLWPTYTNSSITMTLYSTKYVASVTDEQKITDRDQCKVVITTRTRTFLDGTTKKDSFRAQYLPKEGVRCDGGPTAGATTTSTAAPRTTNKPRSTTPSDSGSGNSGDSGIGNSGSGNSGDSGSGNSGSGDSGGGSGTPRTTEPKPKPVETRPERPAATDPPVVAPIETAPPPVAPAETVPADGGVAVRPQG